jgi:molybdopterin-guanine dinucleotide biosynthesis protein MobB
MKTTIPALAFIGVSGSGKTTLITKLIHILRERGYRIGVIKHVHHDFVIDHEGKDSFLLKAAGAHQVTIVSKEKIAFVKDLDIEPKLEEIVADYFDPGEVDLILVEGFSGSGSGVPKIIINRGDEESDFVDAKNVVGLVSDKDRSVPGTRCFSFNEAEEIADLLEGLIGG